MGLNQLMAAAIAPILIKASVHPATISLFSILVGTTTSILVILLHDGNSLIAALIGIVGWQAAYTLDCLDGQVARATSKTSPEGAVLDLLADFMVQSSVVLAAVLAADFSTLGLIKAVPIAVFVALGWMVSPFYSGILEPQGLGPSEPTNLVFHIAQHARDYGLHVALLGVAIGVNPLAVRFLLIAVAILNVAALLLGVARYQDRSRRSESRAHNTSH